MTKEEAEEVIGLDLSEYHKKPYSKVQSALTDEGWTVAMPDEEDSGAPLGHPANTYDCVIDIFVKDDWMLILVHLWLNSTFEFSGAKLTDGKTRFLWG